MDHYGAADMESVFLTDFAVPVVMPVSVSGGTVYTSGKGILNVEDVPMLSADGQTLSGQTIVLSVKAGAFPGLVHGVTLTVNGTDYTVVTARNAGTDGGVLEAYLRKKA